MRSRILQACVLGLGVLALAAMLAVEARADPAARDKWVSKDGKHTFQRIDVKTGAWKYTSPGSADTRYHEIAKRTDKVVKIEANYAVGGMAVWLLRATDAEFNSYDKAGKNLTRLVVQGAWK